MISDFGSNLSEEFFIIVAAGHDKTNTNPYAFKERRKQKFAKLGE